MPDESKDAEIAALTARLNELERVVLKPDRISRCTEKCSRHDLYDVMQAHPWDQMKFDDVTNWAHFVFGHMSESWHARLTKAQNIAHEHACRRVIEQFAVTNVRLREEGNARAFGLGDAERAVDAVRREKPTTEFDDRVLGAAIRKSALT